MKIPLNHAGSEQCKYYMEMCVMNNTCTTCRCMLWTMQTLSQPQAHDCVEHFAEVSQTKSLNRRNAMKACLHWALHRVWKTKLLQSKTKPLQRDSVQSCEDWSTNWHHGLKAMYLLGKKNNRCHLHKNVHWKLLFFFKSGKVILYSHNRTGIPITTVQHENIA